RDKELVRGKSVAIIGGGDAALENARILAGHAKKIYLIHRRSEFSARREFVDPVVNDRNIEIALDSKVVEFRGDKHLNAISISDGSSERLIEIDAALIRIGVQPNFEIVGDKLDRDRRDYIDVDRSGRTSFRNVFAAGDVAAPN